MTRDSTTTKEICDLLGRQNIAREVRVGPPQVSNAAQSGVFPARWYLAIKRLCLEAGISCPESLFTFVFAENPPAASAAPTQEQSHDSTPHD